MPIHIQLRRGTSTEWSSANPVLFQGEIGLETDTRKFKVGDGTTAWTGDADLEAIILAATGQAMNSRNASKIEFDFIPLTDFISFNFLFVHLHQADVQDSLPMQAKAIHYLGHCFHGSLLLSPSR